MREMSALIPIVHWSARDIYIKILSSSDTIFCTHRADRDELVGMIHHCDQEIEKHDDVDDGEAAEHDQAPEPGELLDPRKFKVVQVY